MVKPKIDLDDPVVAAVIQAYQRQAKLAHQSAAAKDDAVRPVYALNERTQSVQHAGSCVLLSVDDQVFALSASHVFDHVGSYQLLIGCGDQLHSLAGDRFSTKRGPSSTHADDPIDASVFHITAEVPDIVRSSALRLSDFDLSVEMRQPVFYVAAGYRLSQSKSTSKGHVTKLDRYPTIELDETHYLQGHRLRESQLLLAFEEQVLVGGKWQTAPSIRGFSGGAMFRLPGVAVMPWLTPSAESQVKLAAILIERNKGVGTGVQSAAVGTRPGVYFGLIHKYLPELKLDEILTDEHERQMSTQ